MIYSFSLYFLGIFLFLFSIQPVLFWIVIEINLISFIFLIFIIETKKKIFQEESIFLYFIIQSLGRFLFLLRIYLKEEIYIFYDLFFLVSLTLKLGIFPLFFWIVDIGRSLGCIIFILILSVQKIPIFLIFFNIISRFTLLFLFSSLAFGGLIIFFSRNIYDVLIYSSIYSSFWVYLIYLQDLYFYLSFFFIYFISIFFLVSNRVFSKENIFRVRFFIFICGLPPFSIFFFKFFIVYNAFQINLNSFFLLFWTFRFISLIGYFKFFYSIFFLDKFLYLKDKFCFKKISFLISVVMLSGVFLAY